MKKKKRKTPPPPVPRRVEPPPKACSVCGTMIYRGKTGALKNFRDKETCSKKCGYQLQSQRATGTVRHHSQEETPQPRRQGYSQQEETEIGRSLLRRYVQADGGFPSDGSRIWSDPIVYLPGDPDFAAVAATVTPIERIPNRMESRPKSWELC